MHIAEYENASLNILDTENSAHMRSEISIYEWVSHAYTIHACMTRKIGATCSLWQMCGSIKIHP